MVEVHISRPTSSGWVAFGFMLGLVFGFVGTAHLVEGVVNTRVEKEVKYRCTFDHTKETSND